MLAFTVLGATVLASIIMNEANSAYRFLTVEGSYMHGFTVGRYRIQSTLTTNA